MTPPAEGWFDRLAARPHTRRQGLKAAAMGTAGVIGASLPFAHSPATAAAASDSDCRKGCVYFSNQEWAHRQQEYAGTELALNVTFSLLGPGAAGWTLVFGELHTQAIDRELTTHRRQVYECFQPGCSGFDPKVPGGPCDGCEAPFYCNPCAVLDSGYICCVYAPKDCHGDCCPSTVTQGCP